MHTPSSLGDLQALKPMPLISCLNRPFEFNTTPITLLLQKEFGEFRDDCEHIPSIEAQDLLQTLTIVTCQWHTSEGSHLFEVHKVFRDAGLHLTADAAPGTELADCHRISCDLGE